MLLRSSAYYDTRYYGRFNENVNISTATNTCRNDNNDS